ncbi:hypothetical protein D3C76_1877130 [compost metagenome]
MLPQVLIELPFGAVHDLLNEAGVTAGILRGLPESVIFFFGKHAMLMRLHIRAFE